MSEPAGKHASVSWETVAHYIRRGESVLYPLAHGTERDVTYEVDGHNASVSLLVELARGERPPRSSSTNIEVTEVVHRGKRSARIRTTTPDLVRDFHELAFAVATRIIADKAPLQKALTDTIRSWHRLIDSRSGQQGLRTGLHGELAVLNSIASAFDWQTAVDSWVGPLGEVHDFSLEGFDLEVKTTAAEALHHTVNGLDQLTPKIGRELWCVSIQLARGGAAGRTLAESIEACLASAKSFSVEVEARLAQSLESARADSLVISDGIENDRWNVRSAPLLLHSSDTPRITSESIPRHALDRIKGVSYEIDLTGIPPSPNAPLDLTHTRLP